MTETPDLPIPMLFELCSGGTAYEGRPQAKTNVHLDVARQNLSSTPDYLIRVSTPYMLIVRTPMGAEISVTINGELLIKHVESKSEAIEAACRLINIAREAFQKPEA